MKRKGNQSFWKVHSLSIVSIAALITWIVLYRVSSPDSHWGSFFGNAVADWTGLVVVVLATKSMYEKGSAESKQPPPAGWFRPVHQFVRNHSLTIFLVLTGIGWVILYAHSDVQGKWGQVVGNIVSEWTQILGLVLMTKKLVERGSKENGRG
ncbi:MAG TPA: hypothetical protein VH437_14285 [Terriglobales bacterium]|jgi:membrane protease YdiL (CAAX protease family)